MVDEDVGLKAFSTVMPNLQVVTEREGGKGAGIAHTHKLTHTHTQTHTWLLVFHLVLISSKTKIKKKATDQISYFNPMACKYNLSQVIIVFCCSAPRLSRDDFFSIRGYKCLSYLLYRLLKQPQITVSLSVLPLDYIMCNCFNRPALFEP